MKAVSYTHLNFHPGSHVKQGTEIGIQFIAEMLNEILSPAQTTTVLLETMAGKGSEVGRTFEELRQILDLVELESHMGVCLDTCHIWDGGYDIVNHLDDILTEFDNKIGLKRLKAIHLNDSQNPIGAHKDRHAKLGEGYIGLDTFKPVSYTHLDVYKRQGWLRRSRWRRRWPRWLRRSHWSGSSHWWSVLIRS